MKALEVILKLSVLFVAIIFGVLFNNQVVMAWCLGIFLLIALFYWLINGRKTFVKTSKKNRILSVVYVLLFNGLLWTDRLEPKTKVALIGLVFVSWVIVEIKNLNQ